MKLRIECVLFVLLTLAGLAGCRPPTATVVESQEAGVGGLEPEARSQEPQRREAGQGAEQAAFPEPQRDDLAGGQLVEETWDAFSMQDVRVGYARTTVARVQEGGRELIRTRNFTHTELQRAGQTVSQDLALTSWETPDGRLLRFESRMSQGASEMVAAGIVAEGRLGIDVTTPGRKESQQIPWQPDWGGVFAADQSLRRMPLKPGEKRTVRGLLPVFNIPGDTHLEALAHEMVDLPSGPARLLKVKSVVDVGGQKIESLSWVDDRGAALKSSVPAIGQTAVRTTKSDALRRSVDRKFDLLVASTVPLKGTLDNPQRTKRVLYRARVKEGRIEGLFSQSLSQRVKPIDDQTAEIVVTAVRPNQPASVDVAQQPPVAADLAPSSFIQSDDARITEMAGRIAPGLADSWQVASALEVFVDETIREKNFSQAFATAAEVARSLEGDCTEHAVLMAALCRARRIPARVAVGLVYYPPLKGFAYHMWNEVWIADRWVPMDATLGLAGIGADHLKLSDSNLAGGSPLAELLSVIQVLGRVELEVLDAE